MRFAAVAAVFLLPLTALAQTPAPAKAALHIVLVLDGLRPDSINSEDTPNLYRLRSQGVTFANSHAVFPTVTRVNAAALATGSYPERNGLMANNAYITAVDPLRSFNTDNATLLLRLGDRILTAPTLSELMHAAGEKFVVVSSGSAGGALLLAPKSPKGVGMVINVSLGDQVSYPNEAGAEILKRFGRPPAKHGAADPFDAPVAWAMNMLDEYVLPQLKPRVIYSWMTEPDHSQHAHGLGSAQAVEMIRKDDALIGAMLRKLADLGLDGRTDVIVVSDHGFSQTVANVNVAQELRDAGLMKADSDEVVLASSGQAVGVHVKNRDHARIQAIAEFLQRQPWCGLVFTARGSGAPHEGFVRGTFSLEIAHLGGHERSPDLVFTFPWSSARNAVGIPGTDSSLVASGKTGPASGRTANHGGIGPWTVRNTMLAWGPDFKRGVVVRTPAANVDVAPTIAYLLGMQQALEGMQGRALLEALVDGPDQEQVPAETRTLEVSSGDYGAALQVSEAAGRRYIDKGWRLPAAR